MDTQIGFRGEEENEEEEFQGLEFLPSPSFLSRAICNECEGTNIRTEWVPDPNNPLMSDGTPYPTPPPNNPSKNERRNIVSRWISTKEELPQLKIEVLAVHKLAIYLMRRLQAGECTDDWDWFCGELEGLYMAKEDVTHWMPLPPLPKGVERS